MKKPNKITLLFILIFLLGVLGFITYINKTLNKKSELDFNSEFKSEDSTLSFKE